MEEGVEGSGGGGVGRKIPAGEVELKEKSGTAWSHSFLNQKPWHPLSYPNQRRKWIAEQIHTNRARRDEEVQREFAQEQEFFRQTALFSKKDKEKMEVMKAVSFMYVRPPGYNPESAKAAEIEDEKRKMDQGDAAEGAVAASTSSMPDNELDKTQSGPDKKRSRPKDVFGRSLPTEQEFEVLKNAPRLDTGAPARPKPFGVEVRNVRCLRCGNYGHQSGDRECPMKDIIMPNEESRLKRDDPLTAIKAQTDSSEPLKWELKQKPGMSPPRGGYNPDDPNQQIVAEDIFDEYGGFLGDVDIPALLTNFSTSKSKKSSKRKSKHKESGLGAYAEFERHHSSYHSSTDSEPEKSIRTSASKRKKKYCSESSYSDAEVEDGKRRAKQKSRHRRQKKHVSESSSDSEVDASDLEPEKSNRTSASKRKKKYCSESSYSDAEVEDRKRRAKQNSRHRHKKKHMSESSSNSEVDASDLEPEKSNRASSSKRKKKYCSESSYSDAEVEDRKRSAKQKSTHRHKKKHVSESSSDSEVEVDTRRHPKREHMKKKKEAMEITPSSLSRDKGYTVSKRHSREKQHNRDSSSSESRWHPTRWQDKRPHSDASSSEDNRHSRRSREKRHRNMPDFPGSNKLSRRLNEKRDYTDLSARESDRRARRPREKSRYSDPSTSEYSDSDRRNSHRRRRRK
ncbi:hypothetical protein QYE76_035733 [Lolium multiflorum]|uniref:CBF1-interacting co-repressor CIR N-terminal domain-containing protein n=1 Tax=Lolium multiflorum TaxID=4521 RepID=A0AAD8QZN2_LOLMU|nr:hypothetical protein QYE76_035733 [Lolium multiflorum]